MSFLDPYSPNRRVPLVVWGRLLLLVIAVLVFLAGRWLWFRVVG